MVELRSIEGGKKEPCPYCGHAEHPVPLACPRIKAVTIYEDGDCMEIEFHDERPTPITAA